MVYRIANSIHPDRGSLRASHRYGADADGIRQSADAAKRPPQIANAHIAQACGTCHSRWREDQSPARTRCR
ncbi:hypothetical protein KXR50_21820 [Sinorhizobium meliloti]